MTIGAHVSANGGLVNIFNNAEKLGVKALQCFASPPSNWNFKDLSSEDSRAFIESRISGKYGPIFFHGIYLMNFASENSDLVKKSNEILVNYLNLSVKLGIDGVIFHIGSTKEKSFQERVDSIVANIKDVLKKSNPKSILIFENSAGAGGTVGKSLDQFKSILENLNQFQNRIRFCFDTCHAFASGYDLRDQTGLNLLKKDIADNIGLDNVVALHINDCKGELGSNKDRHANIGQGNIGLAGFKLLAHDSFFNSIPWILEVPGFNNNGPDRKNVEILETLVK